MRTQAVSQTLLSLSLSFALFADQVAAFLFSSLLCFMGLFLPLSRCQIGCISVSLSDPSSLPKPEVSSLFPRSRPLCFLGFFFSQSRSLSLRHSSGFSPFPSFAFFCFPLFSRCIWRKRLHFSFIVSFFPSVLFSGSSFPPFLPFMWAGPTTTWTRFLSLLIAYPYFPLFSPFFLKKNLLFMQLQNYAIDMSKYKWNNFSFFISYSFILLTNQRLSN